MKRKHTQAKKANRLNLREKGLHTESVFLRRINGIYGADCREFDKKHPRLEDAVEGIRQRIAQAEARQLEKPAL